ncbi:hypothetical protein D3C81_1032400 [compost metagenome]
MADGGHAHGFVLEQALHDLHAHFLVEAVHRLGRRVTEHVEDPLSVIGDGLAGLVDIEDDLRTTENYTDDQRREQYYPEQLDR